MQRGLYILYWELKSDLDHSGNGPNGSVPFPDPATPMYANPLVLKLCLPFFLPPLRQMRMCVYTVSTTSDKKLQLLKIDHSYRVQAIDGQVFPPEIVVMLRQKP